MSRELVIILGAPGCGNELLAGVLGVLGVDFGDGWDSRTVSDAQQNLMKQLRRDWSSAGGVLPLPAAWWRDAGLRDRFEKIKEGLAAGLAATSGPIGLADPETSRLLPLWSRLLAELSLKPRLVLAARHPRTMADELFRSHRIPQAAAEMLWLMSLASGINHAPERLPVVHYEQWFTNPGRMVDNLRDYLGMTYLPILDQVREKIGSPNGQRIPTLEEIANPHARRLQARLQESHFGAPVRAGAIQLAGEVLRHQELFAAWFEAGRLAPKEKLTGAKKEFLQLQARLASAREEARELESQLTWKKTVRRLDGRGEYFSNPLLERIVPRRPDISKTGFPRLADHLAEAELSSRKLKICILLPGEPRTAPGVLDHAAGFLAARGHRVTVASTTEPPAPGRADVEFLEVPDPDIPPSSGLSSQENVYRARRVYEFLKDREFDLVHATQSGGELYYCLLAKHLGLAFTNTMFCITASTPLLGDLEADCRLADDKSVLLRSHLERKCLEYADWVIAPTVFMLRQMLREGTALPPGRCFLQPNILPIPDSAAAAGAAVVRELVVLGGLHARRELKLVCRALDILEKNAPVACRVTFTGNPEEVPDNLRLLEESAKNWSFDWRVVANPDAYRALDYIGEGERAALIPSAQYNSSSLVLECLRRRIPFLATDAAGVPELIAKQDRSGAIVVATPAVLADRLAEVIEKGLGVAQPFFGFSKNLDTWTRFHQSQDGDLAPAEVELSYNPLVSVCLAHYNRADKLAQALDSIRAQTYRNFEVVLVDDGSDDPDAIAYLNSLEEEFRRKSWKIVRQENLNIEAVRNTGARNARGEYLLLMDDDNIAKPNELEVFVKAAVRSRADILTCFADIFTSDGVPGGPESIKSRIAYLGDNVVLGAFLNCFGDSNSLIRRSVFTALGGLIEAQGIGNEDQEFFARAVLHGYQLRVVPEALFYYRMSGERRGDVNRRIHAGLLRVMLAYFQTAPVCLRESLLLAQGSTTVVEMLKPAGPVVPRLEDHLAKLKKLYERR